MLEKKKHRYLSQAEKLENILKDIKSQIEKCDDLGTIETFTDFIDEAVELAESYTTY